MKRTNIGRGCSLRGRRRGRRFLCGHGLCRLPLSEPSFGVEVLGGFHGYLRLRWEVRNAQRSDDRKSLLERSRSITFIYIFIVLDWSSNWLFSDFVFYTVESKLMTSNDRSVFNLPIWKTESHLPRPHERKYPSPREGLLSRAWRRCRVNYYSVSDRSVKKMCPLVVENKN